MLEANAKCQTGQQWATDIAQSPTQPSVGRLVDLIDEASRELAQRATAIATVIAGSVPRAVSKDKDKEPEPTLLSRLEVITCSLTTAMAELERAQRSL